CVSGASRSGASRTDTPSGKRLVCPLIRLIGPCRPAHRNLFPLDRSASGYRRYGELALSRLHFIRRAQALGFSLREVRDLLSISAQRDVARIKRTAPTKLADIDQRVLARQRIRNGLATLIAACPGHGRAADCPI